MRILEKTAWQHDLFRTSDPGPDSPIRFTDPVKDTRGPYRGIMYSASLAVNYHRVFLTPIKSCRLTKGGGMGIRYSYLKLLTLLANI